jgi:hypothetical protein
MSDKSTCIIAGINDQKGLLVLDQGVLDFQKVKDMIRQGQKFVATVLDTEGLVDVVIGDDGELQLSFPSGERKSLKLVPTFT